MYSIGYVDVHYGLVTFVGDQRSILSLANMLEGKQIVFSVANVLGFPLSQDQFGVGGFEHWKQLH